jgi:hypothetical protein
MKRTALPVVALAIAIPCSVKTLAEASAKGKDEYLDAEGR